jgi:hypothetical protein
VQQLSADIYRYIQGCSAMRLRCDSPLATPAQRYIYRLCVLDFRFSAYLSNVRISFMKRCVSMGHDIGCTRCV